MQRRTNKYLSRKALAKDIEDKQKKFRKNQMLMQQYYEQLALEEQEEEFDEIENNDEAYDYDNTSTPSNAEEPASDNLESPDNNNQTKSNVNGVPKNKKAEKKKPKKVLPKKSAKKKVDKAVQNAKKAKQFLKVFFSKYGIVIIIALIIIFIFMLLVLQSLDMITGKGSGGTSNNGGNQTSQSYAAACDAININNSSLSRSEFINKTQEYYSSLTSENVKNTFISNAGTIYDIATNNNINPEMVIIRAIVEGHSPGGSTNNYWGIGCTNTGGVAACHKYSSFSDGVLAYVENISQYDSVSSMMSKYAYIGKYWYSVDIKVGNTSGSGVGGCYYYPYLKDYLSSSRNAEVANYCNYDSYENKVYDNGCLSTSGGANCEVTIDEDQVAYSKYQVLSMAGTREKIFGIGPDSCDSNSGECTIYAQGDSKWGSIKLGNSNINMAGYGCAVTAIAIGISCSGAEIHMDNFDAGTFVESLNEGECFDATGGVYWNCSKISKVANVQYLNEGNRSLKGLTNDEKTEIINSYDLSNHFVLVHFVNKKHVAGHWVVYDSTSGDYYIAKDPAGGVISNISISEVDRMIVYSY